jgi:6-pyruvoyltetrahydropterin/6-carboxytetrahydropterin synthase
LVLSIPARGSTGTTGRITLFLAGDIDERGFVVDFIDLAPFARLIDDEFDHRHLNDVLDVSPTSENLARQLHDRARERWPQVVACAVSETPSTCAVYAPGPVVVLPG